MVFTILYITIKADLLQNVDYAARRLKRDHRRLSESKRILHCKNLL
jgi:hypothetical protein